MRRFRAFWRATAPTVAAAVAFAAAALAGPVAPAHATDEMPTVLATTALPLPAFAETAVDGRNGHVFVSGGPGSTDIAVTDLDGQFLAVIPGQQGATGLAISADGTTLYAALADVDSISAIDTATLTERDRYHLGAATCPNDLALSGGRIWFSHACDQYVGAIGSLDLSGPAPVVSLGQGGFWYYPTLLASAGPDKDVLVAGQAGRSPATVTSFDTSGADLTVRGTTREAGEFLKDLEVEPDGDVLTITHNRNYPIVFAPDGMTEIGYYNASYGATTMAVRPDGQLVTGVPLGILDAFAINENRKVWISYDGLAAQGLSMIGLDWAPNGRRVYTVTGEWQHPPTLRVLVPPPVRTSIDAFPTSWPVLVRKPMTMTGRLTTEDNTQTGAQTLHVTRRDRRGLVTLPDVRTAADGSFSFTDVPRTDGETTYTITFDGTDVLAPTQGGLTMPVAKR